MRVLDLFAGLGGWGRPFRDRGHEVVTLDFDPRFGCDFTEDILGVDSLAELEGGKGRFDLVLASPPCETFSVASLGHHWTGGRRAYIPKTEAAKVGLAIMEKTFALIKAYNPEFYAIENPRGLMRKMAPTPPQKTVWYCRLGEKRAKPTDLWTNVPVRLPSMCRNGNPDCDHERAPRGSKTGTQGLSGAAERAVVPYGLALTLCLGVEFNTDEEETA